MPPDRNVNDPAFLDELRTRWRPTLGLSLGCIQIFRPPLLECFDLVVNYHDGLVPHYRGVRATAWSLYRRERFTGYTYHRMDARVDTGHVLLQGRLGVEAGVPAAVVSSAKTDLAARDARTVLDRMVSRDPGQPQPGGGGYFSRRDRERICRIEHPENLDAGEILHRLHCFELIRIRAGGVWYEVTSLRPAPGGRGPSFRTRDGQTLSIHRALFLPPSLYRFYRGSRL